MIKRSCSAISYGSMVRSFRSIGSVQAEEESTSINACALSLVENRQSPYSGMPDDGCQKARSIALP